MKPLNIILTSVTMLVTGCLITGCGNDLSLPKANAEITPNSPTQNNTTALTTSANNLQSPAQNSTDNPSGVVAETPPERTSMWVTLAGMKCH